MYLHVYLVNFLEVGILLVSVELALDIPYFLMSERVKSYTLTHNCSGQNKIDMLLPI